MALKLVISNKLDVPIKGKLTSDGKAITFDFSLHANRLTTEEYREAFSEGSDGTVREFLEENVTGWKGQRLVLGEDDKPAEFSPEAFGMLLSIVGMEAAILEAYVLALQVSRTPQGRSGN